MAHAPALVTKKEFLALVKEFNKIKSWSNKLMVSLGKDFNLLNRDIKILFDNVEIKKPKSKKSKK